MMIGAVVAGIVAGVALAGVLGASGWFTYRLRGKA